MPTLYLDDCTLHFSNDDQEHNIRLEQAKFWYPHQPNLNVNEPEVIECSLPVGTSFPYWENTKYEISIMVDTTILIKGLYSFTSFNVTTLSQVFIRLSKAKRIKGSYVVTEVNFPD